MNYEQLVKALRWCDADFMHECDNCLYVKYKHCKDDCMDRMLRDAAAAIEDLQAQLPKRGEWIKDEEQSQKHVEAIYRCSACHNFDAWGETELYPYCPNCGAKMEVQDDRV